MTDVFRELNANHGQNSTPRLTLKYAQTESDRLEERQTRVMILIYGVGGMGREAAQLVRDSQSLHLAGFIDDAAVPDQQCHELPVMSLADASQRFPHASVALAVGDPAVREQLLERMTRVGLVPVTLVHPRAEVGDNVTMGRGTFVGTGSTLTCDITVGVQVQINAGCLVHHDCIVNNFATLSPRVCLLGSVTVDSSAFIGAGAVIHPGRRIGSNAVVGMGAVVLHDVPDGETWVGNPAHRLSKV